jgi:TolB protein
MRTITIAAGVETSLRLEFQCVEPFQIAFVGGLEWQDSNFGDTDIYVIKSNGHGKTRLTFEPGADMDPAWSPDGEKIVFASDRAGNREIYVMNKDGSSPVRLTDNAAPDCLPAYSPDGKRIAFISRRSGNADIYVMNVDGTNVVPVTTGGADDSDPAWSPDGTRIAFSRDHNVYLINSDGTGEIRLTSAARNRQPAWSPDGKTIAFLSEGRDTFPAVYLMNADGSNVRRVLGIGYFPSSPDWSPDGKSIAFDDWDCWDYGPCPRGIIVGTLDGIYSIGIDNAAQPAWRPR